MRLPEMRTIKFPVLLASLLMVAAAQAREPRVLEWMDLVPDAERQAWEKVPEQLETLNQEMLAKGIDELTDDVKLPDVLKSTAVRDELDGQYVRLPGFLVPLEYNDRNEPVTMFLVPYFGACIHLPPPPPNQLVYVRFPEGAPGGDDLMYEAYWVTGTLKIESNENDLGISSYAMDAQHLVMYE